MVACRGTRGAEIVDTTFDEQGGVVGDEVCGAETAVVADAVDETGRTGVGVCTAAVAGVAAFVGATYVGVDDKRISGDGLGVASFVGDHDLHRILAVSKTCTVRATVGRCGPVTVAVNGGGDVYAFAVDGDGDFDGRPRLTCATERGLVVAGDAVVCVRACVVGGIVGEPTGATRGGHGIDS